jgi:hypothetical protein
VRRYVAMTPLYAGTTLYGLSTVSEIGKPLGISKAVSDQFAQFCGSCPEFLADSDMVKKLNQGGAAVPGIQYTTIPTKYDELVVPYTSGILHAHNATNMVLQDVCPTDTSEHLAEAFDPVVAQLVFNALDPARAKPVSCSGKLPPADASSDAHGGGHSSPGHGTRGTASCVVPNLRRMTVGQARRALRRASCRLGTVRRPKRASSRRPRRVTRQSTRAGTRRAAGYRVNITLA